MADNVSITAGSGTNVATDDIGGVHYQRVKVALGADGSATDAATGSGTASSSTLRVVLASDSPGVTTAGQAVMSASLPVVIASNQSAVAVAHDTAAISSNGTALTPKFAAIAASSSGNNTLVAAVTSKKVRVLALNLISNGTVNVKVQSGASGTDLTGLWYLVANAGLVLPFNPVGWFETGSNTLLNLNLSAAIAVGGSLVYVEV